MIESFLLALTNSVQDGRILITRQPGTALYGIYYQRTDLTRVTNLFLDWKKSTMKFLLLNPELHFQDIVQQARAVILAGGTMQPVSPNHLSYSAQCH